MHKTLDSLRDILVDEIKKVNKKGDITPDEMEPIYHAVKTVRMINEMIADEGHSGHMPYIHHDYDYYHGNSYNRSRSPVTGRYISGGSIMDKMIARLESMYDEVSTDHERQVVDQWIKRLQNGT